MSVGEGEDSQFTTDAWGALRAIALPAHPAASAAPSPAQEHPDSSPFPSHDGLSQSRGRATCILVLPVATPFC